jgi:hypothetical protein
MEEEVNENDPRLDFNNTFLVTGLPVFTPDKCDKYFEVLKRRFSVIINPDEVYMPYDEKNNSKGLYCFLNMPFI